VSVIQEITRPGAPAHNSAATGPISLGPPVYVEGFNEPLPDIWLVRVLSGQEVVGAFSAAVRPDGRAAAGSYSGFAGPFPNPLALAQAMTAGSTASDPSVSAELVWTTLGARQGIPNGPEAPFWRIERASGATVLVLTEGRVMAADELR
jgi:hypothetical protein